MINLSWANEMAKAALQHAQQRIDSVLDIQSDGTVAQSSSTPTDETDASVSIPETMPLEIQTELPSNETDEPTQHSLLNSFLRSIEITDTESLAEELDNDDDSRSNSEKNSPISTEPVLPPMGSRRSSHRDENLTVVSSDIEVIRQVDAWSVSSKMTNEEPMNASLYKTDALSSLQSELKKNKQKQNEMSTITEALHKQNSHLQSEIESLGQQISQMSKELGNSKKEHSEVLDEAKRMSDYSAKQSKEIRRLKNEMGELNKLKNDNKRLKEDKISLEEKIDELEESKKELDEIVSQLELECDKLKKDLDLNAVNSETIEEEKAKSHSNEKELEKLRREHHSLLQKMEILENSTIGNRLAEERAVEIKQTMSLELQEARLEIQRLTSQVAESEKRMSSGIFQTSNIADVISSANAPLLDEIAELKSELNAERMTLLSAESKIREYAKQLSVAKETFITSENKYKTETTSLRNNLNRLRHENNNLEEKILLLQSENESIKSELGTMKHKMSKLSNDHVDKVNEIMDENFRKITALKHERDNLSEELKHLRSTREVAEENVENPQPSTSVILPKVSFGSLSPADRTVAQEELVTISNKYDSSLRVISNLEKENKRVEALELQNREYRNELKDLTQKYNELLEIDGEKMEMIEELEHDIIDLRKLMKEQLLEFASRNGGKE